MDFSVVEIRECLHLFVSLVVPEMVLSSEGLPADVAGEGPLVSVGPLVDKQIVAFGEVAGAKLANELLFGACSATRGTYRN